LALVDEVLIAAPPAADEHSAGRLAALHHCLKQLDADHRRLLEQRYADGVEVQALAQALGKSPNAVSMILLRLKTVLQRCVAGTVSP
jgi:RNA polymerase sigma-70 factor (ECF subfamily)